MPQISVPSSVDVPESASPQRFSARRMQTRAHHKQRRTSAGGIPGLQCCRCRQVRKVEGSDREGVSVDLKV
ncbi:Uncharacterised protein [Mycobacterium tuberculosis]|uniref:Uncharacterized protein n=1 Tax=Mycobacterium tuberculosis TaxID=1773 RepID=A0A0U0QW40_MYCTX|nr:Uncharacterised protein [Mycobacterium tuberculosis]COX45588.1 Uncharacterised protein [Mycobacterium tuberculosis]